MTETSLAASYFDGQTSKRRIVRIALCDAQLVIHGDFGERRVAWARLDIGEAVGSAPRRIALPDGAYCEIEDAAAFDAWLCTTGHRAGVVERLQRRWHWVAASFVGVVVVLTVGYVWLLPVIAERLAPRIPVALTEAISRHALQTLDKGLLRPSGIDAPRQARIRRAVARVAGQGVSYRLEFRAAGKMANAFALPNGDIVLLDGLIKLADNDEQVAAVVAHELGHVYHRHGWRQTIQASVVSAVVGFYFGDVSSIATGVASLALESNYSREFEREADRYGACLLRAHGQAPALLADMLQRLEAAANGQRGDGNARALSSHPDTAERIAALRALSLH